MIRTLLGLIFLVASWHAPAFAGDELHEWDVFSRLEKFAEVEISPQEQSSAVLEEAAKVQNRPDLEFTYVTSLAARMAMYGSNRAIYETLQTICKRLSQKNDDSRWQLMISASPYPNAYYVKPTTPLEESLMGFTLGLFAFANTVDDIASIVAHEMTHGNSDFDFHIPVNVSVEDFIDTLASGKTLTQRQREEIRADLGAVERMISGRFNPWAYYRVHKRLAAGVERLTQHPYLKMFFEYVFRKEIVFMSTHPAGDLRTTAIKAYIAARGYTEDLSDHTSSEEPLPLSLKTLKLRSVLFSAPVDSVWTRRALIGILAAAGLWYASDWFSKSSEVIADIRHWLSQNEGAFSQNNVYQVARSGILYLVGPFYGFKLLRGAYRSIFTNDLRLAKERELSVLQALSSVTRVATDAESPFKQLIKVLELSSGKLTFASSVLTGSFSAYLFSPVSGLSSLLRRSLELLAEILEMLAEYSDGDLTNAELRTALNKIPSFALQNPSVFAAAKKLALNRFDGGDQKFAQQTGVFDQRIFALEYAAFIQDRDNPSGWIEAFNLLVHLDLKEVAHDLFSKRGPQMIRHALSERNPQPGTASFAESLDRMATLPTHLRHEFAHGNSFDYVLIDMEKEFRRKSRSEYIAFYSFASVIRSQSDVRRSLEAKTILRAAAAIAREVKSIRDLQAFVQGLSKFNAVFEGLPDILHSSILSHPEWIETEEDINILLSNDVYWPAVDFLRSGSGRFSRFVSDNLRTLKGRFPAVWRFNPGTSEALQALIAQRLREIGAHPVEVNGKFVFWSQIAAKGVTAISDSLFAELYETAPPNLKQQLESLSAAGYVWEPDLTAKIAERQIVASAAYQNLKTGKSMGSRQADLNEVIGLMVKHFPDRGLAYERLLEKISWSIKSSEEESEFIHQAKLAAVGGTRQQDFGIRLLSVAIEEAHTWSCSHQWEFIRFLREEIAPTAALKKTFSLAGPERIRRLFLLLPLQARAMLLDSLLDSPKGLIGGSKKTSWSKTIIDHLLRNSDPKAKAVSQEILTAFLHSLEATGNGPLQSYVLAYVLSMPKSKQGDTGEILKSVLEMFGSTGIKIGQFLVAAEILPEKDSLVLRTLQEKAKEPTREGMYADKREIFKDRPMPLALGQLKGSASIKYAVEASDPIDNSLLILKVLRIEALAHTELEFRQLQSMAEFLRANYGAKYGVFRAIVRASREAVKRELNLSGETQNSKRIWNAFYQYASDSEVTVKVPEEFMLADRVVASRFAPGVSIFELPPAIARRAANKIMQMETDNLFSNVENIVFDPDRHPGNYRIDYDPKRDHLTISPIDFGQVISITSAERGKVLDLFAISQILRESGSCRWGAEQIASILGLPSTKLKKLEQTLRDYFPNSSRSEVTAYFSLLAALDDIGEFLPIQYFDFIRAIVQLKQYEALGDLGENSPTRRLAAEVQKRAAEHLKSLKMTLLEKARFACSALVVKSAP